MPSSLDSSVKCCDEERLSSGVVQHESDVMLMTGKQHLVRTVRDTIDRIPLSPGKGRGQGEGYKRDSYFSSGP